MKDECSFKPKVSAYSSQLADKIREHSLKGNYQFYEIMTQKMKETNRWKAQELLKRELEAMKE